MPGADIARIDSDKLLRYALDPASKMGRHKPIVFERALGIGPEDWKHLRDSILRAVPCCPGGVRALGELVISQWDLRLELGLAHLHAM